MAFPSHPGVEIFNISPVQGNDLAVLIGAMRRNDTGLRNVRTRRVPITMLPAFPPWTVRQLMRNLILGLSLIAVTALPAFAATESKRGNPDLKK